jgi:hypothetical protein
MYFKKIFAVFFIQADFRKYAKLALNLIRQIICELFIVADAYDLSVIINTDIKNAAR